MKKGFHFYLFILSVFFYNLSFAQVITKTENQNGTDVSYTMDKKVGDIMNDLEEKCSNDLAEKEKRRIERENNTVTRPAENRPAVSNSSADTSSRPLTNADICRQNPRILGYKIQLAVVKSNEEAREVGMYFRRRFPNMKVEIDASLRPNYKVMTGSYFNKNSAAGDLSRIRQYFKSAMPIQYRIFCVEAK